MQRVLITGSSGFIGSNLSRRLVQEGYEVHGVDIEPPKFDLPSEVETNVIDLREEPDLIESDVIVHLAAHSQVQPIVSNPKLALENIEMTQHIFDEADRMDAFVINASSRDVYGDEIKPAEQDVTPDSPNGYAASKLGAEAIANSYRYTRNVPATSLRLANVYGPMDTNQRVLPIFISLATAGEELTVYGEGKTLDFVYSEDICDAILSSIRHKDVVEGEAINLGSGTGTSLSDLAASIVDMIDDCPGWTVSTNRSGDVEQYISDISKARDLLGFKPSMPLEQGLRETINWYREHPELREAIRSRLDE